MNSMSSLLLIKSLKLRHVLNWFKYYRVYTEIPRNLRIFTSIKANLNVILKSKKPLNSIDSKEGIRANTLWSWNVVSGLLVWLGLMDDYEERENPLILTIKRGVYCMQTEEYEKAELILHSALQMAQQLDFESAETYILDVLANSYFKKQDYKRAEQVFAQVFNRVIAKGMEANDESIIEISIKLSHIYSTSGDLGKCQTGFDFCLTEQKKRVQSFSDKSSSELSAEEVNSLALLGMCYDYYAKHLASIGKFDKAIDTYRTSYDICVQINGKTHPQSLVLLNDMSATYVLKKDYENALNCLKKAIDGSVGTDDKNLAKFYYNIGSIYLMLFNKDLALRSCRESLSLTLQSNDRSLEKKARKCMAEANN